MRYHVHILEYADNYLSGFQCFRDQVYFDENGHIRRVNGNDTEVVFRKSQGRFPQRYLTSEGLWVRDGDVYVFIDVSNSGARYPALRDLYISSIRAGDLVVSVGPIGDRVPTSEQYLGVKNLKTGALRTATLYTSRFSTDGEHIFAYVIEPTRMLACFDMDLNLVWKNELTKIYFASVRDKEPQLYQDLVIFNVGTDVREETEFEITAFSKADGRVVWTHSYERAPYRSFLAGDKVYMSLDTRMVVLDAATGNTLIDEPSGFTRLSHIGRRRSPSMCLSPVNNELLACAAGSIRVFSSNGKTLLQDITLPRPESCHAFAGFRVDVGTTPLVHDGKIYCKLDCTDGLGAVAILSPINEGEEPTITIKPRIPYRFEILPDASGSHGYRLHYNHDNLDDLVSAVRYELTELTMYRAQFSRGYRLEHDHADPLFNGHVIVSVNRRCLSDDAADELQKALAETENFIAGVMLVVAPFQPAPAPVSEAQEPPAPNRIRFELELHESTPLEHVPEG